MVEISWKEVKKQEDEILGNFNNIHRHVQVYRLCAPTTRGELLVYGVNWSAIGTVDIEETQEFLAELNQAIEIAEKLNKNFEGKVF